MVDHSGHRKRMKEEFLAGGMENWPAHKKLELLLFYAVPQGDVNPLAHVLLDRFGSLSGVLDASPEELMKMSGLGKHTAVLLKLIPAFAGSYIADRSSPGTIIHTAEEAACLMAPHFYGARNEMVYILCMDSKEKMLGIRKVSEGNLQNSDVNVRRIAEECMTLHASYFYLAHNHTSHLAFPSAEDWHTTDVVQAALAPLGVQLVDHLIFVDGDVVSLRQSESTRGRTVLRLVRNDDWL